MIRPNKPRNTKSNKKPQKRGTKLVANRKVVTSRQRRGGGNNDFGGQLASVVSKGYGATLASYPTTRAFAKVYLDPFSTQQARIPDFPVFPSTLLRLEQEFTMTADQVSGTGWFHFAPLNLVTSNLNYGYHTNGTVPSPPLFSDITGGAVTANLGPSPNSATYFDFNALGGAGHAVRIVSFGFAVTNISPALNLAGKWYANQYEPRPSATSTGTDETTMQRLPTYKTGQAGSRKEWAYHRQITSRADLRYNMIVVGVGPLGTPTYNWVYSDDGSPSDEDNLYLGGWVQAPGLAASESFIVRVCGHYEIIGQTRNIPGLGMTVSDTKGLEKIQSSASHARLANSTVPDHLTGASEGHKDNVISSLLHVGENMLPTPLKAIAHPLIDFVGNAMKQD